MLAGDQGRIGQRIQRDRRERDQPVLDSLRLQGRGELPLLRQPQRELHASFLGGRPLGIEQAGGQVDDPHRGVAIAQVAAGLGGRRVADGVELGPDLVDARGDLARHPIELDLVAAPGDRLALRRLQPQAADRVQGAAGGVRPGNPLGIPERKRTRLAGDSKIGCAAAFEADPAHRLRSEARVLPPGPPQAAGPNAARHPTVSINSIDRTRTPWQRSLMREPSRQVKRR